MVLMWATVSATGAINVKVIGGSVHTYLWTGPGGYSASSQDISNVPTGALLIINDGLCNPVVLNFNLTAPLPLLIQEDTAAQMDILCFVIWLEPLKLILHNLLDLMIIYWLCKEVERSVAFFNATSTNYTFTSLAAGIYDIKVTDANGSAGTILNSDYTTQWYFSFHIISFKYQLCWKCSRFSNGNCQWRNRDSNLFLNTNPIQTTATANRFDCRKLYSYYYRC
jgi:hypothetical protein